MNPDDAYEEVRIKIIVTGQVTGKVYEVDVPYATMLGMEEKYEDQVPYFHGITMKPHLEHVSFSFRPLQKESSRNLYTVTERE